MFLCFVCWTQQDSPHNAPNKLELLFALLLPYLSTILCQHNHYIILLIAPVSDWQTGWSTDDFSA